MSAVAPANPGGTPPLERPEGGLAGLQGYFAGRLPGRLAEIDEAWREVRRSGWAEAPVRLFHRLAHSLTGAGATFGYPALTQAARALEQRLKAALQGDPPPHDGEIEILLDRLRCAAQVPAAPPARQAAAPALAGGAGSPAGRTVLLVEDDLDLAEHLASQLGRFGYRVRRLECPDRLEEEIEREAPCAVLMDVVFPAGRLAGVERIARLPPARRAGVKVIFLSSRNDLPSRLAAVRAGCEAYFAKPVEAAALAERLDLLTAGPGEPYRVLVVDDDADLAGFHAAVLERAGFETATLSEPLRIMEPLAGFKPDLILMDVYMPECTGPELAAALRQQESYLSTPIIFLSTEDRLDEQLAALAAGGDEFLTKPIDPPHLVCAVTARARRGRLLGSLISYDSLTGLLNHGNLKQQLASELARAFREGSPVAYAMLDLDRFKSINDTYGHAAGDRLLRNLSFFLRQRLRRSDVVGRYGGDEIAVILPHTSGAAARQVLEEIRASFSQVRHRLGAEEAVATFTCGIAAYPDFPDAQRLAEAADQALYTAKRAGRNRVELAGGSPAG